MQLLLFITGLFTNCANGLCVVFPWAMDYQLWTFLWLPAFGMYGIGPDFTLGSHYVHRLELYGAVRMIGMLPFRPVGPIFW